MDRITFWVLEVHISEYNVFISLKELEIHRSKRVLALCTLLNAVQIWVKIIFPLLREEECFQEMRLYNLRWGLVGIARPWECCPWRM